MTTMLSLILAFMLTMGGSPAVSVSPVNSIGPESGVSHDITGKPRLGEFQKNYPVVAKPNAGNPRLVLNLSFQYKKSPLINLNQAFGMNPVNFTDPMGLDKGTTEDVRWVLSQPGIETGGEFLERDFNNFLSNFKSKESVLQYSAWWLDKYGIYVPGLGAGTKMGTAVTGTTVSGYKINEVERSNRLLWGGFEFAFLWSGSALEPKPVKFEVRADNITPENNAVPESLLKGESDTHAYLGVKNQEPVYTGVTKDPIRRASQHGDRFVLRKITDNPLTTRQAKAVEQVIIENNPQFENIINSIGKYRSWYDDAVTWGEKWLIENGFKWLLK